MIKDNMKKKNKSVNSNLLFLLSIVLLVMGLCALLLFIKIKFENTQPNKNAAKGNIMTSKNLNISITLPEGFEGIEKLGSINISSLKGSILITQNGTNFDNLNDYIANSQNNLQERIKNVKKSLINGLHVVSGYINGEKVYLIYANNRVYFLSTHNASLFGDLDQIAQSFRYAP